LPSFGLGTMSYSNSSRVSPTSYTSVCGKECATSSTNVRPITSGWRVDFNLGLSTFEPNVAGVRNLINFALESKLPRPPRFIFVSTVAVVTRESDSTSARRISDVLITSNSYKNPWPYPRRASGPGVRDLNGYSQSKWVSERILEVAAEQTSLRPVIVRVGQVSGGVNGCWNPLEWIPGIVQSAALTKSLPSLERSFLCSPCRQARKPLYRHSGPKLRSSSPPSPRQPDPISMGRRVRLYCQETGRSSRSVPRMALRAERGVYNRQEHTGAFGPALVGVLRISYQGSRPEAGGLPSCATQRLPGVSVQFSMERG
jgi:hypothetical protein